MGKKREQQQGHASEVEKVVIGNLEQNKENNSITLEGRYYRSGPIPDPKEMKEYQRIDKTFPDRIVSMAEKEQKFRHFATYMGQVGVIVIITIGMIVSAFLAIHDKVIPSIVSLLITAYIVYAYKSSDPKEPNIKDFQ